MAPRARRSLLLAAAGACLVALFLAPARWSPRWWGIEDWDIHMVYHEVPRLTMCRYGQLPLWDPYLCGGMPLLAHPESRFFTPLFGLYLALGTVAAAKADMALHLFLALAGAFMLARRLGLDEPDAALGAAVFALSGMFAINYGTGDFIATAAYIPWALWFAARGLLSLENAAGCALVLALQFGEGGAYIAPITAFTLTVHALASAALRRGLEPLKGLALSAVLAAGLGAVKLLPAAELMRAHPRPGRDYSGFSAQSLGDSLLARDQRYSSGQAKQGPRGFWRGRSWGVDENGMYVGWPALALGLLGLAAAGPEYHALRVVLGALLWLCFGDRVHPSLWRLLRAWPLFSTMRVATRFRMALLCAFAVFVGAGASRLRARAAKRYPRLAPAAGLVMLAVVLADLWSVDAPIWREAFTVPVQTASAPAAFTQSFGARRPPTHLSVVLAGRGVVDCYDGGVAPPPSAAADDQPAYRGELWLDGAEGRASYAAWTPNALTLDVGAAAPGYAVINQNYWPGWRTDDGRPVVSRGGRLAVPVAPEDRRVTLRYRPGSVILGAAVSALTAAALAAALVLRRRG